MWEERESTHPAVRLVWRAEVEEPGVYPLPASEFWGLSFRRYADGRIGAELDGPTTDAATTHSLAGESYWGVELEAHVVLRGVDKAALGGGTVQLPVTGDRVAIGGATLAVPEPGGLEAFVDELLAAGALVADPDVRRALAGDRSGLARRSWQRRYRATTGLTPKQVEQLARARHAYVLLQDGRSPAEAAAEAGYADQAHLTRSLRRIRDETPARIIAEHRWDGAGSG